MPRPSKTEWRDPYVIVTIIMLVVTVAYLGYHVIADLMF